MTAPRVWREVTKVDGDVAYVHSFCAACEYWHAFTWDVEAAYTATERHLINVHDMTAEAAGKTRKQRARRTILKNSSKL